MQDRNKRGKSYNIKIPGKEMYLGISRNIYPDWKGWKIIDKKINGSINRCVLNFYKSFWDSINGDTLSQELATDLFIKAINKNGENTF